MMTKLEQLIEQLCPDGVEYKKVKEVYIRLKGTPITAGKMKEISNPDGSIRIYAGGKTVINANLEDIPNANIIDMPAVLVQSRGIIDFIYYDKPFTFKNEMWAYTYDNQISVKFLYYVFKTHVEKFREASKGMGALPQISLPVTEDFKCPVPPLEVQAEIVRILDKFTELTTELTTELATELANRKKQFEYYRESRIRKCANYKRLSEIVDIYLGLTATPNYKENGVMFISAKNTSNDCLDLDDVKYISEEDYEKASKNAKPQRGDLLYTRVGSNLGHPVIVDTDQKLCIFVSLGFFRIKEKHDIDIRYVKHWMNTELFWEQVKKNVHGAAKVNLNTGWLKDFVIPVPSLSEQQQIANCLDRFEKLCNDITEGLPAEIAARQKQYEHYRELLLSFNKKRR